MQRLTDVLPQTICAKIVNVFTNKVRDKDHFSKRYESLDGEDSHRKTGSFGVVSKAKSEDGQIYAIKKVVVKPNTASNQLKQFLQSCQEFVLLENSDLHHPTIVESYSDLSWIVLPENVEKAENTDIFKIIDAGINVQTQDLWGLIKTEFYMVFEWHSNDLKRYMRMRRISSEKDSQKILCDILQGLDTFHKNGYAHNDLKPDNILIEFDDYPWGAIPPDGDENRWGAKLADFGLSQCLTKHPLPERVGNRTVYDPPDTVFSAKVDIWSFGMICYELAHAWRAPIRSDNLDVLKYFAHQNNNVEDVRLYMARKIPETDEMWKEAIVQCLCMRPEWRPSANVLHKIFSTDESFKKACIVARRFAEMINPNGGPFQEMLFHHFYKDVFFVIVKPVLTSHEEKQLTDYLSYDFPLVEVFNNFTTQRLEQFARRIIVTS